MDISKLILDPQYFKNTENIYKNIKTIFEYPHIYKNYSSSSVNPYFKIIIPYKDRLNNLLAVLKSLDIQVAPVAAASFQIIVVEHDYKPSVENICKQYKCEYIFFELKVDSIYDPMGYFNKSHAFDLAFLYSQPASYYILHDVDIPLPQEFIKSVYTNLERLDFPKFMKPYSERTIFVLDAVKSEVVRENIEWLSEMEKDYTQKYYMPPGGSTLIQRDLYLEVGGHDSDLFWGYAPEDICFLYKVEKIATTYECYDPTITLFHLWHPTKVPDNKILESMEYMYFKKIQDDSEFMKKRIDFKRGLMVDILREREGK